MADSPIAGAGSFIQEHPYETAAIAVVGVLLVWYLFASGSSTPASTTGVDTTGAAAAVQAAQTAANEATSQASIAAGVTNNQTAAAQAVALANLNAQQTAAVAAATAQVGVAGYTAAAEIATANASTANTALQAGEAEQLSNNATIASEFSTLGSALTSFGAQSANTANVIQETNVQAAEAALPYVGPSQAYGLISQAQGANVTTSGSSSNQSATASSQGSWFGWLWPFFGFGGGSSGSSAASGTTAVETSFVPSVNPNLAANNSAFLAGYGSLLSGFGLGLQAPTANISETGLLSLASINAAAVNSPFTNSH